MCVYFTDQKIMQSGDPKELKLKGLEMQNWNKPTDRTQRVDEKTGSFVLLSCLLLKLWSLKCQKWFIFCILYWCQQKIVTVRRKYLRAKCLFSSFRKCYRLLDSELPLASYQPLKIQFHYFFADSAVFWYLYPRYLTNGNSKTN